jgi:prepilin peptidase CpaA
MDWQALFTLDHWFSLEHWQVKLVCVTLIVAAYIDGKQLRVPNWITFPMVLSGLAYNLATGGWDGLSAGLFGMVVGLACLLPLYSVGGMGAGDVKLMAGIGAWLGASITFSAFCVSAIVGAGMAVWMVWRRKSFIHHYANFLTILSEWANIKDPRQLSQIAAERKPRMLLLPYGIPICIGSIAYFLYAGIV